MSIGPNVSLMPSFNFHAIIYQRKNRTILETTVWEIFQHSYMNTKTPFNTHLIQELEIEDFYKHFTINTDFLHVFLF